MSEIRGHKNDRQFLYGMPDHIVRQELVLDARRYCTEMIVSRWDVERDESHENILRGMVYRATQEILSKSAEVEKVVALSIEYPASWWEHFKQRWFPAFMLKRWPVKFKVETKREAWKVEARALLPEMWPIEHRHTVIYMIEPDPVRVRLER